MAKAIIMSGSNGGDNSDDCTATKKQVLEQYSAITKESDDDAVEGKMLNLSERTSVKHSADNFTPVILADQMFVSDNTDGVRRLELRYNGEEGFIRSNTLLGINAQTKTISPSATTQIASADSTHALEKVVVNPVSNLIAGNVKQGATVGGVAGNFTGDANATSSQLLSGYTAYVKGNKVTGTVAVQSILSFNCAVYSSTAITFTWQNPGMGAFSGVIIVGKTGSYPNSVNDGTCYYKGAGDNHSAYGMSNAFINSFASGTTYYFRAFSYAIINYTDWIHGTSFTGAVVTTKGLVTLKTSVVWTVPAGVRSIDVCCVGGGAGGMAGENKYSNYGTPYGSGCGGSGGFTRTLKNIAVTPGQQFMVIVGSGGAGGELSSIKGGRGGSSTFGSIVSAEGGGSNNERFGEKNGGSGGGGSRFSTVYTDGGAFTMGGNGGSDGSAGFASTIGQTNTGGNHSAPGGTGQGTTTRAFGEASGTLYSGGGGGGGGFYREGTSDGDDYGRSIGGAGGAGGGGYGAGNHNAADGSWYWSGSGGQTTWYPGGRPTKNAIAGTASTGGGGGGGCYGAISGGYSYIANGASGGSGVVLIRWGY